MAFEKVTKEKLTEELIKQDLIYQFKNDNHVAINIILLVVGIFFAFLFSLLTPFAWFLVLIPILFLLIWYFRRRKKTKEIENGEFTVVLDKFLYQKQGELRTEATFYKGKYISYIEFSNTGRWELEGFYYAWSDKYKMSGTGICNTSNANDTFYLVLYKNTHKIAIGYNTKYFDYQK